MAKLIGTPSAVSSFNPVAYITDGSTATRWESANSYADTAKDMLILSFAEPVNLRRLEILFATWSRVIQIGYSDVLSLNKADYTTVRTINMVDTPKDDSDKAWYFATYDGVPITASNVIRLPDNEVYSRTWAIYTNTYINIQGGTVDRARVYELSMHNTLLDTSTTPDVPPVIDPKYPQVTRFTGAASSTLAGYPVANAYDANMATRWVSAPSVQDQTFYVVQFTDKVVANYVKMIIAPEGWGDSINIGYALDTVTSLAQVVKLRTIDVAAGSIDDVGKLIRLNNEITFAVPDFPRMANLVVWPGAGRTSTNPLYGNGTHVSLANIQVYGTSKYYGADTVTNPKPPSFPASPFTGTPPASWTRTVQYSTAGDIDYVPTDEDVTLVLFVLQGGGSGGRVDYDLSGTVTAYTEENYGKSSTLFDENGNVLYEAGGANGLYPKVNVSSLTKTSCDWLYAEDYAGGNGATQAGVTTAVAGSTHSRFGAAASGTYTLAKVSGGVGGEDTSFTAEQGGLIPATTSGFERNSTYGWCSTNHDNASTGSVVFQPRNFSAGQVLTFTYYLSSESYDRLVILVGGVEILRQGGQGGFYTVSYTIPTTNNYVIQFQYAKDGSVSQGSDIVYVSRFAVTPTPIVPTRSGATGAAASIYLVAKPYKLRVGAGGLGVTGGQTVPASADGTLGNGGSGGGRGGDGVIQVYEYRGSLTSVSTPYPSLDAYNNATKELPGVYRTNYLGSGAYRSYTHKLRPRTKTVLALIVGAGGTANWGTGATLPAQVVDAFVDIGTKRFTAGSGGPSLTQYNNSGITESVIGAGGVFTGDAPVVRNGEAGYTATATGQPGPVTGIYNSYGNGSDTSYYSTSGVSFGLRSGGSGAYGLAIFKAKDVTDGTLAIQVPGYVSGSSAGKAGNVVIFESEQEDAFGLRVTQTAEQILIKSGPSKTNTTQVVEQFLLKAGSADTQITQVPELMLVKESDLLNNLQVSHATVAFIVDGEDPETYVTQSAEQILLKAKTANTQITQSPELVFMRAPKPAYRTTQVAELLFISEVPSVFWLNFGTLVHPDKNALYTSLTGRASSVQPGAYIQLEGLLAPGTTLFVNGVDVGLSSPIKDNDRVYIYGGVPNYWTPSINVYTYYLTNDAVTRELVGRWNITHRELSPVMRRSYAEMADQTWIRTIVKYGFGHLVPVFTKLLAMYDRIVGTLVTSGNNATAQITSMFTKTYDRLTAGATSLFTKTYERLTAGAVPVFDNAHINVSEGVGYSFADSHSNVQGSPLSAIKPDAISNLATLADYEITKVSIGVESGLSTQHIQATDQFVYSADFLKTSVYDSGYSYGVNLHAPVGMSRVSMGYDRWNVGHVERAGATFEAVLYTRYFGIFDMEPIRTKTYSVLSGVNFEKSEIRATGTYGMDGAANVHKAGYGVFETGTVWTIAYTTTFGAGTLKSGASELGYFDTSAMAFPVGSSKVSYEWERAIPGIGLVDLSPLYTTNNIQKVDFTSYRYAQSENGRGKASLYLGFDSISEANTFTQNFSDVVVTPKFNGFTYTVGVDKTFVCEIYFNGPVSGLIQGG